MDSLKLERLLSANRVESGSSSRFRLSTLLSHLFPRVSNFRKTIARSPSSRSPSDATNEGGQRSSSDLSSSEFDLLYSSSRPSLWSKIVRSVQGSSRLSAESLETFNNILFLINSIPSNIDSLSIFDVMLRSIPEKSDLLPFLAQIRIPKSTLGGTDYSTFVATLSRVRQYLPQWYYGALVLGRSLGKFDKILQFASTRFSQELKVKSAVTSAVAYPAFMLLLSLAAISMLLIRILPQNISTFESMGLPVPSMLSRINYIVNCVEFYWFTLLFLIPASFSSRYLPFRAVMKLEFMKMHTPLGHLRFLQDKSTMLQVLSFLSKEQMTSKLLLVSSNLNGNRVLQHMLENMASDAKYGASSEEVLSYMLTQKHIFSPYEIAYLQACFMTGKHATIQEGLRYVSQLVQREYADRLAKILGLLNPVTTLVVGLLVGLIALIGIGPLVQLTDAVSSS